jgi:CubicO group peptidase (beta-lactamase class C family)
LVFLGLISILRLPGSETPQPINREKEEISLPEPEYNTEREIFSESLSEWVSRFDEIDPINSILISQHGELVTEEYFGSMHANRAHNIKSASKSILSVLTGIAIEQDYLEGVDQEIGGFFPEYFKENPDSVKASITIGDMLTMRSGLASTSRANYGRWVTSSHWVHYALDRPLTGKPGIDRTYSTGNTHLLAVIIARASGMNTLEFANRYLFDPMDIRIRGWDRDPQGNYLGGNNMAIIPRDMIKLGQLMMNMGVYNGKQLVSGEWITRSIEPVTGRRTGINNYGFLWFRRMSGNFHVAYAFGNGGQYIMILPELEAVISVTTRNNTSESTRNYRRELFRQLDREVIPRLAASFSPA